MPECRFAISSRIPYRNNGLETVAIKILRGRGSRICIHARPIDEPQRVRPRISSRRRIIVPIPVVVQPILDQEMAVLGIEHGELGVWLLERWNMPEEILIAVRHHHHENYDGPHAVYPRLALLADRMLKGHGIGDAPSHDLPAYLLEVLGLQEIQTVMVMGRILEGIEGLNVMARNLAAA